MGPLTGLRVIEMAGIGPTPFCGMLLADMGAEVLRVDRPAPASDLGVDLGSDPKFHLLSRGKRSIAVDIKSAAGRDTLLTLVGQADALIEGFRPGTMERLGLAPAACLVINPKLVYGRMTGWGQSGPAAQSAGHDIDYIALSGVLHAIGPPERPTPPLNLVGDFGGGAMFLAFGVTCALLECARSGRGQVVDAAMVDGSAYLMTPAYGMLARGLWRDRRDDNILDGGAPWYGTYETSDGKFVAVGAIEQRFYAQLLEKIGLAGEDLPPQNDRSGWPMLKARFAAVFRAKSREEWERIFAQGDACVAPVLSMTEAHAHPHNRERANFIDIAGVMQPAPAPRFSRSVPERPRPASVTGEDTNSALIDWGFTMDQVRALRASGAIGLKQEEIQ